MVESVPVDEVPGVGRGSEDVVGHPGDCRPPGMDLLTGRRTVNLSCKTNLGSVFITGCLSLRVRELLTMSPS